MLLKEHLKTEQEMAPKPPISRFSTGIYTKFEEELEKKNRELTSQFRDLNISLLSGRNTITFDKRRIYSSFNFLRKNRNIIDYAFSIGGILTGSRALRSYKINDKYLFDREAKDWDILITKEMMYILSDKYKFNFNLIDKFIRVSSERWVSYSSYSDDVRYLTNDINFIIVDELPDYTEVDGIKVSKIMHMLNSKRDLMSTTNNHTKNYEDLTNILIRFKLIKNE